MENMPYPNRLHKQLVHLIALETAIEQNLKEFLPEVSNYTEATALLNSFLDLPRDQKKALEERLNFLSENAPPMKDPAAISVAGVISAGDEYPVSTTLQIVHTMFNQAVIGYSTLTLMGTRFLDSPYFADEGTSFHLAKQHMENYAQAIQQITHMLHDVLLSELDDEGFECQCQCPSCGAGICLCSMAGRLYLSLAWEAAGPILKDGGIYVQLPKQNSAATKAGLQKGDFILAADEQEIDSYGVLQSAIRDAELGEEVQLTVRRRSNELEEVAINL
jgi:membrane-associated protease RseP (regulator of RpoE activity)